MQTSTQMKWLIQNVYINWECDVLQISIKKVYAFGPKQQLINHGIVLLAGVGDLN